MTSHFRGGHSLLQRPPCPESCFGEDWRRILKDRFFNEAQWREYLVEDNQGSMVANFRDCTCRLLPFAAFEEKLPTPDIIVTSDITQADAWAKTFVLDRARQRQRLFKKEVRRAKSYCQKIRRVLAEEGATSFEKAPVHVKPTDILDVLSHSADGKDKSTVRFAIGYDSERPKLATPDSVLLFHDTGPRSGSLTSSRELRAVLESPYILKVGFDMETEEAGVKALGVTMQGACNMAAVCSGFSEMTARHCRFKLDKSLLTWVRVSDWDQPLQGDAISYAALDAWLPLIVYTRLTSRFCVEYCGGGGYTTNAPVLVEFDLDPTGIVSRWRCAHNMFLMYGLHLYAQRRLPRLMKKASIPQAVSTLALSRNSAVSQLTHTVGDTSDDDSSADHEASCISSVSRLSKSLSPSTSPVLNFLSPHIDALLPICFQDLLDVSPPLSSDTSFRSASTAMRRLHFIDRHFGRGLEHSCDTSFQEHDELDQLPKILRFAYKRLKLFPFDIVPDTFETWTQRWMEIRQLHSFDSWGELSREQQRLLIFGALSQHDLQSSYSGQHPHLAPAAKAPGSLTEFERQVVALRKVRLFDGSLYAVAPLIQPTLPLQKEEHGPYTASLLHYAFLYEKRTEFSDSDASESVRSGVSEDSLCTVPNNNAHDSEDTASCVGRRRGVSKLSTKYSTSERADVTTRLRSRKRPQASLPVTDRVSTAERDDDTTMGDHATHPIHCNGFDAHVASTFPSSPVPRRIPQEASILSRTSVSLLVEHQPSKSVVVHCPRPVFTVARVIRVNRQPHERVSRAVTCATPNVLSHDLVKPSSAVRSRKTLLHPSESPSLPPRSSPSLLAREARLLPSFPSYLEVTARKQRERNSLMLPETHRIAIGKDDCLLGPFDDEALGKTSIMYHGRRWEPELSYQARHFQVTTRLLCPIGVFQMAYDESVRNHNQSLR